MNQESATLIEQLQEIGTFPIRPRSEQLMSEWIGHGRSVLKIEGNAVLGLAAILDEAFAEAVEALLNLRGRVVVAGMGKSGHIARKIAATLASTGTPALFVHPAEAAHGDLGMVTPGDAVIMLSNSGETSELRPMIAHATRLGLPMIAISSKRKSSLMQAATIQLLLQEAEEACPANIAPTTSTTMMLALGDALAMVVMRERGVSRDNFEQLHPGGAIGLRLTRVSGIMHRGPSLPLVSEETPMREVVLTITQCSFGAAGVLNADGELIGVITDGDLRRHFDDLASSVAADVMTRHPVTCDINVFAEDALKIMNHKKITSLFVVEPNSSMPVGLVHVHDFLRVGLY